MIARLVFALLLLASPAFAETANSPDAPESYVDDIIRASALFVGVLILGPPLAGVLRKLVIGKIIAKKGDASVEIDGEGPAGDVSRVVRRVREIDRILDDMRREIAIEQKTKAGRLFRRLYVQNVVAVGKVDETLAELSWWTVYDFLALVADQNHVLGSVNAATGEIAEAYWFEKIAGIRENYELLPGLPAWSDAHPIVEDVVEKFLQRAAVIASEKHVEAANRIRAMVPDCEGMPTALAIIEEEVAALLKVAGAKEIPA